VDKPAPVVSEINRPYFEGLKAGILMLQRCSSCGEMIHYPRITCPHCLSYDLEWVVASGDGSIASFAEVHKPQHPAFNDEIPITLIAVQLAEGPLLFARLSECTASALRIGASAKLDSSAMQEGTALPLFRLD
jgi:uncharacterized protein